MKFSSLLFLVFLSTNLFAQDFKITGKIIDSTGVSLEAATVYLQTVSDSTLVTYTITDKKGFFELKGASPEKSVNLFVSYTGYQSYKKQLQLDRPEIDLGNIVLLPATSQLGEVVVTAEAPVLIKSDTLQFNADSFNTKDNANLEELLKKLPGVLVDNQGNITVNGKPVNKILVNGEEFFGGDPKIATKNLPKEIIDKIQVVSTKTEQQEFTGEAGDPDKKTINIELKEDMDKGYFSRITAGGGTDDRYTLNGIANYFDGDLRVSVLGSTNNINDPGFSFNEIYELMGSVRTITRFSSGGFSINGYSFGSGQGITKSTTAGVNITNKWDEKTELGGNYFYARSDTKTRSETQRENILPDRRYFTNSFSTSNSINDNHRADLEFEWKPDTLTRLSISPHFDSNSGFSRSISSTESLDETGDLINTSETSSNSENHNATFSNRLNFIRRFGGDGAFLQFNFSNNHNKVRGEKFFFSERVLYEGPVPETETQNQFIDRDQEENEYDLGITNRSVLAKDFFLDVSYDFEVESGNNSRKVFDFNSATGEYSDFDEDLSNVFEYSGIKHIPNVGLSLEGEKWRGSFDAGLLSTTLKNEDKIENVVFEETFNNLYLRTYLRYKYSKSANVYLRYRTSSDIPSLQQLQPVTDRTNPLNIVTGNPNLKPEFKQSLRFGLRNYDFATRSGYYFYGSLNFTDDQVVSISTTGEDLIRTTTYTNVDGNYSMRLGGSYNKRLKKEKRIFSYSLGLWSSFRNSVAFTNGLRYESESFGMSPRISLGYEIEELFSVSAYYNLNYNFNQYDIFQNREENYTNHYVSLDIETYWPENLVFENDINYGYDGNVPGSFDPTSLLWNAGLGYQFLDDDATIELKVYDLLGQKNSTSTFTGDDFIQSTKSLVLERYFMLSLTYKLTKFGGKDPNNSEF